MADTTATADNANTTDAQGESPVASPALVRDGKGRFVGGTDDEATFFPNAALVAESRNQEKRSAEEILNLVDPAWEKTTSDEEPAAELEDEQDAGDEEKPPPKKTKKSAKRTKTDSRTEARGEGDDESSPDAAPDEDESDEADELTSAESLPRWKAPEEAIDDDLAKAVGKYADGQTKVIAGLLRRIAALETAHASAEVDSVLATLPPAYRAVVNGEARKAKVLRSARTEMARRSTLGFPEALKRAIAGEYPDELTQAAQKSVGDGLKRRARTHIAPPSTNAASHAISGPQKAVAAVAELLRRQGRT